MRILGRGIVLKKIGMIAFILCLLFVFSSTVFAQTPSTGWTGHGLYLLNDADVYLKQANIDIVVNSDQTSTVTAEYRLENKEDKIVNVYFGVPEHEVQLQEMVSWVLPYRYGNSKLSGKEVNDQVQGVDIDYNHWRTWHAPFQPGEERTVKITYQVDNKYISEGKYLISFQLDHIHSWKGDPDKIDINVYFDNKETKVYNFGNEFSMEPDRIGESFTMNWSFDSNKKTQSIDFAYYYMDHEIINFLKANDSSLVKSIAEAYENGSYTEVIQKGKEYIKNPQGGNFQNEVYFLMASSYLQTGQPEESLIIYELIEGEALFKKELQEKIQHMIAYNKINCYLEIGEYKTLYELLLEMQEDDSYGPVYQDWVQRKTTEIPQEVVDQVIEENKELEGLKKIKAEVLSGKYDTITIIILAFIGMLSIVSYSVYRKKKDKNTLFKK